ncbi:hypothetical protein Sm713_52980 [Streptomyces sp. TS71-3]|nr:hypothetical protein Sm713_52980 [Streptomyces sp. TS71-3]
MVSRVLITGSSGMLGRHLVARFAADGRSVTGLDIASGGQPAGVREVIGDIRDPEAVDRALEGADLVVHCAAALPSYPAEEIRSIIVEGTRTLLSAARRQGVHRTVHISSTAVYGLPDTVPTPENPPVRTGGPLHASQGRGGGPRAALQGGGHGAAGAPPQDLRGAGPHGAVLDALRMGRGRAQLPRARPR